MTNNIDFAHKIAALAQRAVLYEVSVSPKPGLVDRYNSGSHKDMDFFTFLDSATALYKGFFQCTLEGLSFTEFEFPRLMDKIRPIGREAEKSMFSATNGVNTHKGIIFSIGILCAAVGSLYREDCTVLLNSDLICKRCSEITKNLVDKDFESLGKKENLTNGELLFKNYNLKGIRGEVESGFKTVREKALPIINFHKQINAYNKNDLYLEVLINLIAYSEDTNVAIRSGIEGLNYVKNYALEFLKNGGMSQCNAKEELSIMNRDFIERNISPGGSADLLAVTIFLSFLENKDY